MKLLWLLAGITLILGLTQEPDKPWVVIIGGQTHGYLSPCGCVKPMTGGILRKGTAVHQLTKGLNAVFLENGGLISATDRQSQMKAEALAESLAAMHVDAINVTAKDMQMGYAMLGQVQRLSGEKLLSTLHQIPEVGLLSSLARGPFMIAGVQASDSILSLSTFMQEAKLAHLQPVVMTGGGLSHARKIAEAFPQTRLVIYASSAMVDLEPIHIGETMLVSAGEKGKAVLRVVWNGRTFQGYEVMSLGPDLADDKQVKVIYQRYLSRVKEEKLLDKLPRTSETLFAGSKSCQSCHADAYETWSNSDHAKAFKSLEDVGHDYDPECVACHVIGLKSKHGFISRSQTPQLTDVGCESCHGSGVEHVMSPHDHPMGKAGSESCQSCHVPDHSPGFTFEKYWPQVRH